MHDDSKAAESASAVNALAYTVGNHIVFGAGQYSPGTLDGNRLLAHELTHTIQQTGGAVLRPSCRGTAGLVCGEGAISFPDDLSGGSQPSSPVSPSQPQPESGQTVQLPDIEPKNDPVIAFPQVGSMSASLGYQSDLENTTFGGQCPSDGGHLTAGLTTPRPPAVKNIKVTPQSGTYLVSAEISERIEYQVCGGLGSELQLDITSDSDPHITADNFADVAADLTPDANGVPRRRRYWASDLTLKHELFHVHEWARIAQSDGIPAAEQFLFLRGTSSVNDVQTALAGVPKIVYDKTGSKMSPGAENRAYADGAPLYQARADSIRSKGTAGGYSGNQPHGPQPGGTSAPSGGGSGAATTPVLHDAPDSQNQIQQVGRARRSIQAASQSTAVSGTAAGHAISAGAASAQAPHDCQHKETPEDQWADANPGKVFGVGDAVSPPSPSDELILWNFCVGEAKLRAQHTARLAEAGKRWQKKMVAGEGPSKPARRDLKIKAIGGASKSGSTNENEALALQRATAVEEFLKTQGIPQSLIEVLAVGSRVPLADETSPENAARNRRVEVFLYVPTQVVGGLGPTVDADVRNLMIGRPSFADRPPFFDPTRNLFVRQAIGMEASANVTLTSLVSPASAGFIQFLVSDDRWAEYASAKGGNRLILDYEQCISSYVPCRDVEEATSQFSVDRHSLFHSDGVPGKVSLNDMPGVGFPLRHPEPISGEFVLTRYHWGMSFVVVLGVREGSLLMPLQHARWSVAASEGVDVPRKTTTGPPPVVVYGSWEPGASLGFSVETAMSGKTCRLAARSVEIAPEERPCRPSERRE